MREDIGVVATWEIMFTYEFSLARTRLYFRSTPDHYCHYWAYDSSLNLLRNVTQEFISFFVSVQKDTRYP